MKKSWIEILCKGLRIQFIYKVLKYRLSTYEVDVVLDFKDYCLVVLKNQPGILIFKIETTCTKPTHFEVYLRQNGVKTLLGVFYFDMVFPDQDVKLKLITK